MKEYVLFGQVQQRITAHMKESGTPIRLGGAIAELRRDKAYQVSPELPAVSFLEWDGADMDVFRTLIDQTPVSLEMFNRDFQADRPIRETAYPVDPQMDVFPVKIPVDQAIGIYEHKSFEMFYVLQGQARLLLGTSSRNLGVGDFCLTAPNSRHGVAAEGHSVVISISFAETTIENTLYRLLKNENVMADFFRASLGRGTGGYLLFHMEPTAQVRFLIRNIFHESYSRQEYASQTCANYIEILFACLLRSCAQDWEIHSGGQKRPGAPLLPIMQYIQANYRAVSLQEVARRFHYEPSYLGKLIRAHMGKNYTAIVSELRIEDAKALLRRTDDSIEKVSEQAGFQSGAHFSRTFRQFTGMTPRQYRKQMRGDGTS